ncbi:methyltransferase domain-containing protein [Candidatus Woesearchaeota archaeon]|nr:methyltransferase domain-containing protein [Candidatus Woesearchaeota archaeon]
MQIQTFTEFVGEIPEFEDHDDFYQYLKEQQKRYFELNKTLITQAELCSGKVSFQNQLNYLSSEDYEKLGQYQKEQYTLASKTLELALHQGKIDQSHLQGRVLDFGCGRGGSSIFLNLQSEDVTAIDRNSRSIQKLKETGLFPEKRAISEGAFGYIGEQPESIYDLITAFGLGWNNSHLSFIKSFYEATERGIKPNGKIIIVSDLLTMDKTRKIYGHDLKEDDIPNIFIR